MRNFLFTIALVSFFFSCSTDESNSSSSSVNNHNRINEKERFEKLSDLIFTSKNSLTSKSLSEMSDEEIEKEAIEFYTIYSDIKNDYISTGGDEVLFNEYFIENLVSEIASKADAGGASFGEEGCWRTYLAGLSNCSGTYVHDLASCPGSPYTNPVCVTGSYFQFVQCSTLEYISFSKCIKRR